MLVHCTPPPPPKKKKRLPWRSTTTYIKFVHLAGEMHCEGKVSCLTNTWPLHWHNYLTDQLNSINSLVYQSYWQVDNDKLIRSVGELTTLKGVYELTNSVCKLVVGELTCQQSDWLQPKKTTQLLNCGRPWSNEAIYWQPLAKSNRRIILVILFIIHHIIQGQ